MQHASPPSTPVRPEVSVLVVSYNTIEMTLACLASIASETTRSHEVIVFDNNSADGSADRISAEHPGVQLIRSTENLGFAAANNVAAEHARAPKILLLNPDTVVTNQAIDRLLEFAARTPSAGIWGGRTLFRDGSLNPTSCWAEMTLWSVFCRSIGLNRMFPTSEFLNRESYGRWQRDRERDVDIVTGCLLLIDSNLWIRLRGFDPTFFLYGEEADLCFRARKLGFQPRITPEATIFHFGGGSEPSSAEKLIKTMRGKVTLMNVHWTPGARRIGQLLFLLTTALRAAASLVIHRAPPPGAGADRAQNSWRIAFRRRAEWINGWPAVSRSDFATYLTGRRT